MNWEKLAELAQEVINETLDTLPDPIKNYAEQLPLSLESAPSEEMQKEGIDDDTLGLFVGESIDDAGATTSPMPGQILLFLENIWEFAGRNQEDYREEIRVTFLHELGHYLGWDEEDLFGRDLD